MIADPQQFWQRLSTITETAQRHPHWSGILQYTNGIKYLAEQTQCNWLIDAICHYQTQTEITLNTALKDFQLWLLTVSQSQGQLKCYTDRPDTGELVIDTDIPVINFPLPDIELHVKDGTLFLPTEHESIT